MGKLAVGFVAVATLAAGIILSRKAPRMAIATADEASYDIDDLYEAGL
jgi:hypothetical protein